MDQADLAVSTTEFLSPQIEGLQRIAGVIGAVGAALCLIGWFVDPTIYPDDRASFFHSYLYAYLLLMGATGGSLVLLMIHHVVGGGWGYIIRRFLEAATRLLPLMLVLFIPVIIGLFSGLYEWNTPTAAADPILRAKAVYLNVPFFLGRTLFYFAVWMILAFFLDRWGATQDVRADVDTTGRLNYLSSAGLIFYAVTGSFAAFDWVMSLTPKWYSTIYGLLFLVCQVLTAMALMLFLFARLAGNKPLTRETPRGYFRDLGNLMLTLIMLWAYMSFSQYMLTFTGNSTEEVTWYVTRAHGGWGYISLALIPIHFFLPFMVLLVGSGIKRDPVQLGWVAFYVIFMRLLDVWWWVTPAFRPHLSFSIADAGTPLLLGGIWLWFWAWQVKGRPMVPLHDPRVEGHWLEAVEHD